MKGLGWLVVFIGIILGLYVGGWLMFIQPIIACAAAFDSGLLTGSMIAITALKCVFASFVGSIIAYVFAFIGGILMEL